MKTLLASWISCARVALRKSSVAWDVKIDIMKMCFSLIPNAKIAQDKIEMEFQSLCEQVVSGIQHVILSHATASKASMHILGHGVCVTEELEVSCIYEYV